MTDTIIPRTVSPGVERRPGLVDRAARAVILRSLEAMSEGRLVLAEDAGTRTFGRRDPATPLEDLSARAVTLAAELEQEYPESNQARGMFVEPMSEVVFASVRPVLWLLFAVVGLLVAVAFVNVVNLLLARGTLDARTPGQDTEEFLRALEERDVSYRHLVLVGAGHEFDALAYRHRVDLYESVLEFLDNDCGI